MLSLGTNVFEQPPPQTPFFIVPIDHNYKRDVLPTVLQMSLTANKVDYSFLKDLTFVKLSQSLEKLCSFS